MSSENKPSALGRFFGFGKKAEAEIKNELEQEKENQDSALASEEKQHSETESPQEQAPEDPQSEAVEQQSLEQSQESSGGLFTRWRSGLGKTRSGIGSALGALLGGKRTIDEELAEEIETILLTSDVGIETTTNLIERFRQKIKKGLPDSEDLMGAFRGMLVEILDEHAQPLKESNSSPQVIMMVGVNGVGKTTSIGKLAKRLQAQGRSVILAAGDTFRAAAVEQLQVWGERNDVPVVAQSTGADSASVIYDALESSRARGADVLIADTAGRLHNKGNLMEELSKIVRVIQKLDSSAPHEIFLVLDAATGQNALSQAREFCKSVPVTGLILTKLDGTAKGGVVFALVEQLQLPVKFVGLGEGIDDLTEFDADNFVSALFDS